jgi:hypothetical protein
MNTTNLVNRSVWLKGLLLAAFAFVGIVGGAYVGKKFFYPKPVEAQINPDLKLQPFHLNLRNGDLFPLEDFVTPQGTSGNFEQLLANRESIIFFVDLDCEPCHDFLRFWNTTLSKRLKPGVQVIACLPESPRAIPAEFSGLLQNKSVVFVKAETWKERYNLVFNPIITGTDNSGFITHIQYGFADEVDYEFTQRFLTAETSSQHL